MSDEDDEDDEEDEEEEDEDEEEDEEEEDESEDEDSSYEKMAVWMLETEFGLFAHEWVSECYKVNPD